MSSRRARADAVRAIPLTVAAAGLGHRKDPADRARWKRPGSVISINQSRFFDHVAGRGGGGAIDLVIHAEGCSFIQALQLLEGLPSPKPCAGDGTPVLSEDREWARVRRCLHQNRGLDPGLIEHCRRIGVLGADNRANAVFTCRSRERRKTGAELVGTRPDRPFKAMAPGSCKAAGGFWIARRKTLKSALLVEGAIDALSAWTLDEGKRIDIVISTAGATGRMPEWINRFQLETVFCGYDADHTGDLAATMLQAQNPAIRRMRPDCDDWNEILQRKKNNPEPDTEPKQSQSGRTPVRSAKRGKNRPKPDETNQEILANLP